MRRRHFDPRVAGGWILTLLGLILLLNVGYFALYTRPVVRNYNALLERTSGSEVLEERAADVERTEAYLQAVEQAEADLETLRDEKLATRQERLVEVQLEFDRLAQQFQVDANQIGYENTTLEDEGLDRFAMVAPLEGGYIALRRFLQAVEDSDKFLVVERVALVKGKAGGVLLQLNITVATYFNAPEALAERKRLRDERRQRLDRTRNAREASRQGKP